MQNNPSGFYRNNITGLELQLKQKKKLTNYLYLLRLITFILFVVFVVLFFKSGYVYGIISLVFLGGFFAGVSADINNSVKVKFLENKLEINNSELRILDHQFSDRKTGEEYKDLNPHLSDDFDVFGMGSLFQYLNRTSTKIGEIHFAECLCKPESNSEKIKKRQEGIKELSEQEGFIQDFMTHGMLVDESGNETDNLLAWLNESPEKIKTLRILSIIFPAITLAWLAGVIAGLLNANSLILPVLVNLYILFIYRKITAKAHNRLGNTASTFKKYTELIRITEEKEFKSEYLRDIKKQLESNNQKASVSLKNLYKLLHNFDVRYNVLVSFILNSLLLYDIQVYIRLSAWKEKHKAHIPNWFEALSEMDSITGFAVYAFNNPEEICWPEVSTSDFEFNAAELGHPLLSPGIRVNNSVRFEGTPRVIIITGANMAGKSTFLRTIAVNLLLAANGGAVSARSFSFSPGNILSSIKIQDSLYKNESYFYAELLRVKEIIEHCGKHPGTLVVLDEILRGTNTKDKQTGSLGILEKLISLKAVVLIATHDLVIGELEHKYPEIVTNYCFEVELEEEQLIFDYKLKPGISRKLNASFLMKKLGLID